MRRAAPVDGTNQHPLTPIPASAPRLHRPDQRHGEGVGHHRIEQSVVDPNRVAAYGDCGGVAQGVGERLPAQRRVDQ